MRYHKLLLLSPFFFSARFSSGDLRLWVAGVTEQSSLNVSDHQAAASEVWNSIRLKGGKEMKEEKKNNEWRSRSESLAELKKLSSEECMKCGRVLRALSTILIFSRLKWIFEAS